MAGTDSKEDPQGGGLDNRSKCFRVIDSFMLAESLGNKVSFVPGDTPIGPALLLEDEPTSDNVADAQGRINKLFKDGKVPLVVLRSGHCLMKVFNSKRGHTRIRTWDHPGIYWRC